MGDCVCRVWNIQASHGATLYLRTPFSLYMQMRHDDDDDDDDAEN